MRHELRSPLVSIIMPCYNHGSFLDDAIRSIENSTADKSSYEVIIVNDGSTDALTLEKLKELEASGSFNIIHQANQGVCAAKNTALKHARGEYILPVDADNMIKPELIEEAVRVFDRHPEVSVVYTDYCLFGENTGIRKAGPYNMQRLMLDNFIENCSMYRKSMVAELGGYDTYLSRIGAEDWELWLRATFAGKKFYYLGKPLFDYRIVPLSRTAVLNARDKTKANTFMDHFRDKFPEYYGPQFVDEYFVSKFRSGFVGQLYKLMLMVFFPSKFHNLAQKGKLRKYI